MERTLESGTPMTAGEEWHRFWYLPLVAAHPAYRHCPVAGELPVASELAQRLLGLPFHLELDPPALREIALALGETLAEAA